MDPIQRSIPLIGRRQRFYVTAACWLVSCLMILSLRSVSDWLPRLVLLSAVTAGALLIASAEARRAVVLTENGLTRRGYLTNMTFARAEILSVEAIAPTWTVGPLGAGAMERVELKLKNGRRTGLVRRTVRAAAPTPTSECSAFALVIEFWLAS